MSKCKWLGLAVVLACILVVFQGCEKRPARVLPPGINSSAGDDAIKDFDTDKDKKISGAELNKCPGLKAAIEQVDKEKTGGITADMIYARIKDWKDSKLGKMSVGCMITRNNQPLADADVKFVPEKFLGDKLVTATGKTDQNGQAMMTVPVDPAKPNDPPGMPPGFYRVEITKGTEVPAKYNTQTVLGQEVAQGAKGMQEGIRFNLTY
jgi:hypothetical protein